MKKTVKFASVALVIFAVFYAYFNMGYKSITEQLKDAEQVINSLPSTDLMFIINGNTDLIKDGQLGRDVITYQGFLINNFDQLISALGENYRKVGDSLRYYDKAGESYLYASKSSNRKLVHNRAKFPMRLKLKGNGFKVVFDAWLTPKSTFLINDLRFDDRSFTVNAEYYLDRDRYVEMTNPFFLSAGFTIFLLPLIVFVFWRNARNRIIALCFYWAPVIIQSVLAFMNPNGNPFLDISTSVIAVAIVTFMPRKKSTHLLKS